MRMSPRSAILLAVLAVGVVAGLTGGAATVAAQEGYPLTGTWYGAYGSAQKHDLTVIMKWDGKTASGTINPGPNAAALKNVVMDITPGKPAPQGQQSTTGTPPIFNVHFEADMPGAAGAAAEHLLFEGTLQNPVAGNRRLVGTVTHGTTKDPFQIRRQ